jgi:hypothetical protein
MTLKRWTRTIGTKMTAEEQRMVKLEGGSPEDVKSALRATLQHASLGFEGKVGEPNEEIAWSILEAAGFSRGNPFTIDVTAAGHEEHSPEWFAREILVELHVARDRAARGDLDRAMMSACRVGYMAAQANLKEAREATWNTGYETRKGAAEGAQHRHGSPEIMEHKRRQRYDAFCAQLAEQGGKHVGRAESIVAERFGVDSRTIRQDRRHFRDS